MPGWRDQLRHVSLIFACGTALFSDGYGNSVIGNGEHSSERLSSFTKPDSKIHPLLTVNTLLTRIYGSAQLAQHDYSRTLTSLTFAGTAVGMLIFGYISDKIGRKFGMMTAAAIVALFSGLSAASSGAHGSIGGLLSMLGAMRFLLGIGIGAEYPCGSVSASEQSEGPLISKRAQHRWFALATNTMIDLGFVMGCFVPLVLFWIFGNDHLRAVWRLSLGLGVVPALAVFFWRLNMEEPDRYKRDSMKFAKIPYLLIFRRYGVRLAGISAVWFLYNLIVYPFGLYSSIVVNNITGGASDLTIVLGWATVINLFYLPGSLVGAFVVDYLGARNTMITGLVLQAIIGFIMSGLYAKLVVHVGAFAVVYGIFLSFGELGPGNCIGLLASKTSPTAVRGQFYGIAAAIGKLGAFVGTWMFPPIIDAFGGPDSARGNTGPFWIGSGVAVLSAIITILFVKPLTTDGMEKEDAEFREYLEANGYDTSAMGLPGDVSTIRESAEEKNSKEYSKENDA
ncbi:putative metabolite transporter [Pholiota conissans]|uniref:Metabolite transporter n=1 Tax=Pholiota conissans TaxID=109636 RepID=A0A9P5Z8P2_9AGAR|nr:putative metabolite transporter [Pholiota conissans]